MYTVTLTLPQLDASTPLDAVKAFREQLVDAERDGHPWEYDVVDDVSLRRYSVEAGDVSPIGRVPTQGDWRSAAATLERRAQDLNDSAERSAAASTRAVALSTAARLLVVAHYLRSREERSAREVRA